MPAISESKLCKDLPKEIICQISRFLVNFDVIPMMKQLLNDSNFHNDKVKNIFMSDENVSENAICLVLSHRSHGKEIDPKMLKVST